MVTSQQVETQGGWETGRKLNLIRPSHVPTANVEDTTNEKSLDRQKS